MLQSLFALVSFALLLAVAAGAEPLGDPEVSGAGPSAEAVAATASVSAAPRGARSPDRWHVQVGAGAGYAEPWQGEGGVVATAHVLAASPTGRFRIGLEGLYRSWETRIFEVSDVDIDTYEVDLVFHYVPFPDAFATPYVGAAIGLQINDISEGDVESGSGFDLRDDVGLGYGITGIAGVEVPLCRAVALYVEGRVSAAYQITGEDEDDNELYADYYHRGVDDTETEDTGSAAAIGGVRIRF